MGSMKKRARALDGRFAAASDPGKPKRKLGRPKSVKERVLKNIDISVTVSVGGEDIDLALFERVQDFLRNEAVAGKFSAERGGAAFHLHFQGVVRMEVESVVAVTRMIKVYLGWDKNAPHGAVVMCRALKNIGLHTFHGLLGYCMKDFDKPHFQTVDHNLKAEDIQRGVEEYAQHGAEDKRSRVCLTNKNTFERMAMFWRFYDKHPAVLESERLLHAMVRSGKFYPSMAWIVGPQGRGLVRRKADALLRAMVSPSLVTRNDIAEVFFAEEQPCGNAQPRSEWFQNRWKERSEDVKGKGKLSELEEVELLQDFADISKRAAWQAKTADVGTSEVPFWKASNGASTSRNPLGLPESDAEDDLECDEDFETVLGELEIPLYTRKTLPLYAA